MKGMHRRIRKGSETISFPSMYAISTILGIVVIAVMIYLWSKGWLNIYESLSLDSLWGRAKFAKDILVGRGSA